MTVKVRIRQVLPCDGLSPARAIAQRPSADPAGRPIPRRTDLPGRNPASPGGRDDRDGDTPGKFGRPGRVTLQMTQLVENTDGTTQPVPWLFDTEDRSFSTRAHRHLLTSFMATGRGDLRRQPGVAAHGPFSFKPGDGRRRGGYRPDPGSWVRQLPARGGCQAGAGRHVRGGRRHDALTARFRAPC